MTGLDGQVEAARLWRYTYIGNDMPLGFVNDPEGRLPRLPKEVSGYGFEFVIDEKSLQGKTLIGADLSFVADDVVSFGSFGATSWDLCDGVIKTDSERRISSYQLFGFCSSPLLPLAGQSFVASAGGEAGACYFAELTDNGPFAQFYYGTIALGSWTVAPITIAPDPSAPLPAAQSAVATTPRLSSFRFRRSGRT